MYMSSVPQAKTVHGRTRLAAILADLLCYQNQNKPKHVLLWMCERKFYDDHRQILYQMKADFL